MRRTTQLGWAACAAVAWTPPARAIVFGETCGARVPDAVAVVVDVESDDGAGVVRRVAAHCSGVVLRADVVLTAAHCLDVDRVVGPDATIAAASFAVSQAEDVAELDAVPADAIAVAATYVLAGYDRGAFDVAAGIDNDVSDLALLFLAAPRPSHGARVPQSEDDDVAVGAAVSVAGYGVVDPDHPDTSRGERRCGDAFIGAASATELQIGASSGSVRACDGDSGGPVAVDVDGAPVIVGVHSHARDSQGCASPSIAARVAPHVAELDAAARAACATVRHCGADNPAGLVDDIDGDVDAGVVDVDAGLIEDDVDGGVDSDHDNGNDNDDVDEGRGCAGCTSAGIDVVLDAAAVASVALAVRRRRAGAARAAR